MKKLHSNNKSQDEKDFNRLLLEQEKLRSKKNSLGYIKLDTPIRSGWYYELVLDPKLGKLPKYKELYEFLISKNKGGFITWGSDKKKAFQNYEDSYTHYGGVNPYLVVSVKDYNRIDPKSHDKLQLFEYKYTNWKGEIRTLRSFKAKIPSTYITFKYTKSYITHRRLIDPSIEKRLSEIENILTSNPVYYKLYNKGVGKYKDMGDDFKLDRKETNSNLKDHLRSF